MLLLQWQIVAITLVTFNIGRCLAILCYKCDSVTLADCAVSLDSNVLPTEECKSAFACAMTIVDSVTYRGCSTNTPRGPEYYKTCSENLCNKGVYPPGRLKCHQCSGSDCVEAPTGKPTPCLNFFEDDNCYTDVIDELDTIRGCESDTHRSPNVLAEYCEINGCNDQPGVTTLTCSKCDSADGRGCKIDLFEVLSGTCYIANETTCSVKALLGHETQTCFLYHYLDHIVRGCTFDSGTLSLDDDHFDTCGTSLCNRKCLEQQKCITCVSTTDERCKSSPSSLTAVTCPSAEASSCNACEFADGTVKRGCGRPTVAAGSHCNQCQGEGCNTLPFSSCFKCTSADSPNCAQWTNPDAIGVENCEEAGATCINAILANGNTIRGCEGVQLRCNDTVPMCVKCSSNLCNDGVFPPMRLQCHYCDGRDECSDVTDARNLRPCAQYEADDACFEFLSSRGTMVRGCKSDHLLFNECALAGGGCRLCAGPGCNLMPAQRSPELQCHNCSRKEEACSWEQGSQSLVKCQSKVKFLSVESCYTRRYADGSTSRGCSLDDDDDSKAEEEFLVQTCTEAGCNNKATFVQKCIDCRANKTEENPCTTAIERAEGVLCGNGQVRYEQRGCYTMIDGDFVERGCAVNLESLKLLDCKNGNGCHYCHGVECNIATDLTFISTKSVACKHGGASIGLLVMIFVWMFMK